MVKLKFYYDFLSQPSRTLYIFMKKTEIPFEPKPLSLRQGEHLTKEIESLNPFKKVPFIDDKGTVLIESVAILRYLCRTYNVADHWYPKDIKKQALVDEYLEWQHNNIRAHCTEYFRYKALWPLKTGQAANIEKVTILEKRMTENLNLLENIWLKDKPFLCGDEISVSDLVAACEVEQPRIAGFNPLVDRPNLTKWITRVQSKFSPFYKEAHEVVEQTANEYKSYVCELNKKNS
uniref:glutathione transferase n=1 Tax=Rhopalosiphum padi TaxID=40932 RepID=A0A3Q9C8T5_RHOPD|nr:glutathione S-transferase GST theta1 [Rhopalosiphum padi]